LPVKEFGVIVPARKYPRICDVCASQTYVYTPMPIVTVHVVSCFSPIGVDWSRPGPLRWQLCDSERSLTATTYVHCASLLASMPLRLRIWMMTAWLLPPTSTSFGLSAWATAEGSTRAASSVKSAIRVVIPGLYGGFRGSDFAERKPSCHQDQPGEDGDPEPSPCERQRCRVLR